MSVSFPTPQAAWATAVDAARTVVYRTTDGGRHWEKITSSWPVPPDTGTLPVIQATDAAHAWLLTAGSTREPDMPPATFPAASGVFLLGISV